MPSQKKELDLLDDSPSKSENHQGSPYVSNLYKNTTT